MTMKYFSINMPKNPPKFILIINLVMNTLAKMKKHLLEMSHLSE